MAVAAISPGTPPSSAVLSGVATLAVTNTSGNVVLPGIGGNVNSVTLLNEGAQTCFVSLGDDNTVTALSTGTGLASVPIPAGRAMSLYTRASWLAAITVSGTTTLRVLTGSGAIGSVMPRASALPAGQGVGEAFGQGAASAVSAVTKSSIASASGSSTAMAVGAVSPASVGFASGTGSGTAASSVNKSSVGSAAGIGTASGIAPGGVESFTAGVMVHGGSEANPYVQGWIGFKRGDFFPATMHLVATYPSHTIQCQHDAVQTFSDGSCRQAIVGFYMASTLSDGVEQLVTITPTAGAQAT